MTYTDPLAALCSETVEVSALSGFSTDGYVTATYGSASTYSARVTSEQVKVRTLEGAEELATTVVWILSTSTFGPSDRIALPDGSTPPLLSVETLRDESGVTHSKAFFG